MHVCCSCSTTMAKICVSAYYFRDYSTVHINPISYHSLSLSIAFFSFLRLTLPEQQCQRQNSQNTNQQQLRWSKAAAKKKKRKRVKETHRAGGMSWQAHFGRFINKSVGNDFALYIHTLHTRPVHRHINQMVWLCLGPAMRWTLLFMCSALFCKPLQPHSRPPKWIRRLFQLCLCL